MYQDYIKKSITIIIFSVLTVFISCKKKIYNEPITAENFDEIENDIIRKFGKNSYFTELSISFDKKTGNKIGVAVSKKPELLKIEEWENNQGNWSQNSEISFEKPKNIKASYFMFQLKKDIQLKQLSELINKSKKSLEEKNIKNSYLETTSIKYPKNGEFLKTEFIVKLKTNETNEIFSFNYPLNLMDIKS